MCQIAKVEPYPSEKQVHLWLYVHVKEEEMMTHSMEGEEMVASRSTFLFISYRRTHFSAEGIF